MQTNSQAKQYRLMGRMFAVVAEFPETEQGVREANQFIEENPCMGVLAVDDGKVILSPNNDAGVPV